MTTDNGQRTTDPLPHPIRRYLEKRGVRGPWGLAGASGRDFAGAVIIPALAEESRLPATLAVLAANPPELVSRFLVVVVINHRADAAGRDKEENLRTLRRLAAGEFDQPGMTLAWVDAASPGRELPPAEGVGLARKIGFDLAIPSLEFRGPQPLLVSLDADTLVDSDYLPAICAHFRRVPQGGAVLPFSHQPGNSPEAVAAIVRYELFLRGYVLGLTLAGSPYAFHTVGSAMACRADAYVRAGGMNRRTAGEDFYFLQQMAKTAGVASLQGTVVHPSSRPSARVPFGTGRAMRRLLAGEEAVPCYPIQSFRLLGRFLALVAAARSEAARTVMAEVEFFSPETAEYLGRAGFPQAWERLQRNHRQSGNFLSAFHGWFDGLRTLRLLRFLADGRLPRRPAEEAIPPLLDWAGQERTPGLAAQLALLRRLQNG